MSREPAAEPVPVVTAASELDELLGVYTLFFVIPRAEVVYFRLVVESWEDCAVPRTMHRFHDGDPSRCVVVAMAVPDFLAPCARGLARLCAEIGGTQLLTTPELRAKLREDLLDPGEHENREQ